MLRTWLGKKGFQAETAGSVTAAKRLLEKTAFDLILSDLRLPDDDGITLLPWKKEQGIDAPLIIMTSYADIQNAVLAMKEGASDYVSKPIKPDLLLQKINDALANGTTADNDVAEKPATDSADDSDPDFLEGESEAARKLYSMVSLVAPTQMSVLINGASGTGKEYVAHRIHRQSKRADKPFVAIDCGSIPKELAASEFFGHVKGSFTGALADKTGAFVEANGGTLFLDEVGNLSYEVQVQLLRALQERKVRPVGATKEIDVDVRLVTATNEDLQAAIAKGTFREDLYHRLNEFTLQMPALHERGGDILLFANFFLRQANRELDRNVDGFDAESQCILMDYAMAGQPEAVEKPRETRHSACRRHVDSSSGFCRRSYPGVSTCRRGGSASTGSGIAASAQQRRGAGTHNRGPATDKIQQEQGGSTAWSGPQNALQQDKAIRPLTYSATQSEDLRHLIVWKNSPL